MRGVIKAGAVALALILGTAWSSHALADGGWRGPGPYYGGYHHHHHHGYYGSAWYGYPRYYSGYYRPGIVIGLGVPASPAYPGYYYTPGYWSYSPYYY